jgi:glycosyltransferase involved in cell wall biosynthesis
MAGERLRVVLVGTAPVDLPGSMHAYAGVLREALAAHAPGIDAQLVELDPHPGGGAWRQRLDLLALPSRARGCRRLAPDAWHVLDGSRAYVASGLRGAPVVPLPLRPALAAFAAGESEVVREPGVVLHIGNNGFYKQRAQVLRIFARMDPAHACRLVMAGPPPPPPLRALVGELGLSGRVDWLQDAGDAALADCYRRASVLLFPSLYEGYGWPVLEAMAFGLPVVCSNGGSLPEVAGDAAPCLAPDDIDGFAREVGALLSDDGLASMRSAQGRMRAQQFGLERFAREMADIYRSASGALAGSRR